MRSALGWSGLEKGFPRPRGTGGARDWQSHSDVGPACLAGQGPACASGELLSACSHAAEKVPSPALQAPSCLSAGRVLDERNPGPFLLQASMNAGVSKRIPQAGLSYLPFASGEWNKDRPRVPRGRAGERGLGVVGCGLEPGTLQGQPASPHPLSQPHSPLAQTGEWAVLVPVPMLV